MPTLLLHTQKHVLFLCKKSTFMHLGKRISMCIVNLNKSVMIIIIIIIIIHLICNALYIHTESQSATD